MKNLLMLLLASLLFTNVAMATQSFTIEKDGQTYQCDLKDDYSKVCWNECPYSFSSCKQQCGPGVACMEKCSGHFSTCAKVCKVNTEEYKDLCWSRCDSSFSSCLSYCGKGVSCFNKCPWSFNSCNEKCKL